MKGKLTYFLGKKLGRFSTSLHEIFHEKSKSKEIDKKGHCVKSESSGYILIIKIVYDRLCLVDF